MDERRKHEVMRLQELGIRFEDSQDPGEYKCPCTLTADCIAAGDNSLTLSLERSSFHCSNCGESGSFRDLVRRMESQPATGRERILDAEFEEVEGAVTTYSDKPLKLTRSALPSAEPKVAVLSERYVPPPPPPPKPPRFTAERLIIAGLALVFLCAGLAAAGLSGFANYQAFSASVADPLQARIWGWTGVIAAVISFGGFTFFYWHTANRRVKEGIRALLFALAGAGTSIVGTQVYISANNAAAASEASLAGTNREVLSAQIADWRVQLSGIPPETRSVEGLESYIAEVERVGRTDHKPYRDAKNELGLARRRDDLQQRIDAANAELLGAGDGNILTRAQARTAIPSWFFAGMLELFSSQGTSIGLVALLILFGRRPDARAIPPDV